MIFVGVDWAEAHNDVLVMHEGGVVLGRGRCATGVAGLAQLHALVADHAEEPGEVIVGIEIDRGLLVDSLTAAGYRVYGVNPLAASRYRDRHTTSGAKSDAGDAKLLADLVRTDRHNHRPVAGDTEEAGAIRVLARAHQGLVWTRQRQVNALRSALRDYFPAALCAFGTDLAATDALAILKRCPDASARPGALTGQDRRDARDRGVASATSTSAPPNSRRRCAPSSPRALRRSPRPSAPRARPAWPC